MKTTIALAFIALASPVVADLDSSIGTLPVTPVVSGLDAPWSFGFLPSGGILITEKEGTLLFVHGGRVESVSGVPHVVDKGQGGLLDLMIPTDFATTRQVYLTYAKRQGSGAGTALASAKLSTDGLSLSEVKTIFEITPGSSGGRHFGSRIAEGVDGKIYMTVGDRGDRPSAQDLSVENGSVLRLNRDGTIPEDNPFIGSAIWSYGHRNPQGLITAADGTIWAVEHGARGGDEVNRVEKAANYGWPVIAYGRHYSGGKIGEGTEKDGMEQPEHYWDPSIAPSGATIIKGNQFPEWESDIIVGSLKFDSLHRLTNSGSLSEVEVLSSHETQRVRDVRMGPNGAIWFLSVGNGTLYRIDRK